VESESGVIVAGTDWSISVQSASVSDVPALQIMVHIIDDDERAAEILAPVIETLGALP
jgi:hypothetical protein